MAAEIVHHSFLVALLLFLFLLDLPLPGFPFELQLMRSDLHLS